MIKIEYDVCVCFFFGFVYDREGKDVAVFI